MPLISSKGKNMPESPIRKLVPYAEKATQLGKKIYYLNIGQPDIKSPKIAMDAVANSAIEVLAYSRSEGSDTYREKIANYYKKNNIQVLIHYPSLWHNQKAINSSIEYISNNNAENYVDQIVSIPMHPFLTKNEIENIISIINKFYV